MGLMSKYVIEVYALSGVVVRANDFRKDLRLVGYSYYSRIEHQDVPQRLSIISFTLYPAYISSVVIVGENRIRDPRVCTIGEQLS